MRCAKSKPNTQSYQNQGYRPMKDLVETLANLEPKPRQADSQNSRREYVPATRDDHRQKRAPTRPTTSTTDSHKWQPMSWYRSMQERYAEPRDSKCEKERRIHISIAHRDPLTL